MKFLSFYFLFFRNLIFSLLCCFFFLSLNSLSVCFLTLVYLRRGFHTPYNELVDDTMVLPWTDGNHTVQNFLPNLISSFRNQNYTTDLDDRYALWGHSGRVSSLSSLDDRPQTFNLTTTIRYPIAPIVYTPGVSEVLFDAWIKYFMISVITSWLLYQCFCSYVFNNHLLETYEHVDNEPLNKFSRFKQHLN
mmetsp:Transcript_20668/g.26895  ORF Transcript_20668/g.26895 Transcript_20668/m.26895 type:complete len:191 (-) Transcript_20668:375-947(-)